MQFPTPTVQEEKELRKFLKRERKGKGAQLLGKCHLSSFFPPLSRSSNTFPIHWVLFPSPFFSTKMHQLETAPNFSASNESSTPFLSLFCSEENLIKSRRVIFFAVNFGGTGDPPFPKKESPFFEKNGKLKGVVPLYNVILLCFVPKKVLFSYLQRKYC